MYRTEKPFHGCAKLFVFFSLFVYVVATTSPSQREIEKAQEIVGRFLRNEVGANWLSDLAKTKSAPITAEDLTNAILSATKPEGKVWRAASTLREALNSQTSGGIKPNAIMGQIGNWKDVIADIEKEDDIICLYRKNTEETAKKAEDWKKFLKTVSPGYTVHLAIDTGLKYVICLKKIEVPIAATTESSTSSETVTTIAASTFLRETTTAKQSMQPITPEKLTTIVPLAVKKETNNTKSDNKSEESNESCGGGGTETNEDKRKDVENSNELFAENADDDKDDYGLEDSLKDEHYKKSKRRKLENLTTDLEDFPVDSGNFGKTPIPSVNRRSNFSLKKRKISPSYPPMDTQRRFFSQPPKTDSECNRPIIVVIQDGSLPLVYRPQYLLPLPAQRSLLPFRLPSIPRIPIPRPPLPWQPFNPLVPPNKLPPFTKIHNLGIPIRGYSAFIYKRGPQKMLSTSTHFTYTIPREKNRLAKATDIKAIGQTSRSAFVPIAKSINTQSPDGQFIQQRRNVMPRYPIFNTFPRRVDRVFYPNTRNTAIPIGVSPSMSEWHQIKRTRNSYPNARYTAIPIGGSSGISQWQQKIPPRNLVSNIRNTAMPIRESPGMSEWNQKKWTRNSYPNIRNTAIPINEPPQLTVWREKTPRSTVVPKARIPDDYQIIRNDFLSRLQQERMKHLYHQLMMNRLNSPAASHMPISKSITPFINTDLSRPIQQSVVHHSPTSMYDGTSVRENSIIHQAFPSGLSLSRNQNMHPANFQPGNLLRNKQIIPQNQYTRLNPQANYPAANNVLHTQQRQSVLSPMIPKSLIRNPLFWLTARNNFYPFRNDGPSVTNLRNQLPHYHQAVCPNRCDKPIKLQIFIDGKVQQPLKVSVLTESDQRLEIVGSGNPVMPYGSIAPTGRRFMIPVSEKTEEEKILDVGEVGKRIYDREEVEEKNGNKSLVIGNTSNESKELVKEESFTTGIDSEITKIEEITKNATTQEIAERIFDEPTMVPSSSLDVKSTMSTITNSSIIGDVKSTIRAITNYTIIGNLSSTISTTTSTFIA